MSTIADLIAEYCPNGIEFKTLGAVGTITRGKRFVKADIVESGTPCIHYGEIYTKYGTWTTETFSFLKPELASRLRFAQPGDVIMVSAGETIEDIGKAVAWLGNENVVTHDALYAFRSPLDPKYVVYFSQTGDFHNQIRRYISSGKISAISTENLAKVRIPVPPLKVQREIVKVLDAFAKLEAELAAELRAEIETRRQQYEYYRDALLTFAEDVNRATSNEQRATSNEQRATSNEQRATSNEQLYPIWWTRLGEICKSVSSGGTPSTSRSDYYGGSIPWLRTQEIDYGVIQSTDMTITNLTIRQIRLS